MKIVILHTAEQYIEIVPVEEMSAEMIRNGVLSADNWLRETNREIGNNSWLVFDNDSDEIPVFWDKENIPFVTL